MSPATRSKRYQRGITSSPAGFLILLSHLLMPGILLAQISAKPDIAKSAERIGRLVAEELLDREEFMIYHSDCCYAVHYAEACAGYGAVRLAGILNDKALLEKLVERYTRVIDEQIENTQNHVDVNVYGILPLEIFRQDGEKRFLEQGLSLADGQWANPDKNGLTGQTRFWIDDLYMIGSLQVQAYRVSGKEKYLDRAARQFVAYLEKLQEPNGLFHHGENAPFFWGRGNGWAAAGMAELLSELPKNHAHYNQILASYQKMMHTLLRYQAADGMWRQLIDHPEFWKETSSTAMFGFAMATGVQKGLLDSKRYTEAYEKAWRALTAYVDKEGKLGEVCVGTGKSNDQQFYFDRPRVRGDLHGQAPVLWFAARIIEMEDEE